MQNEGWKYNDIGLETVHGFNYFGNFSKLRLQLG